MDILSVVTTAIKGKLSTNSSLTALVSSRIYKTVAPPIIENAYPYILMSYGAGGLLNDAPYDAGDLEVLVTAISNTQSQASLLAGYIETSLKNQNLTYGDSWNGWARVRQTDLFSDVLNIQQEQYYRVGAYYRFRISKE